MSTTERLQRLTNHINSSSSSSSSSSVPNAFLNGDVVIVSAVRTPICKAKRGGFKSMKADELLSTVLSAVLERSNSEEIKANAKNLIGDIVIGNVLQPGSGAALARMSQFVANLPYEIPLMTVNRQCSSGLQAFINIASSIQSGVIKMGIAGGMESMTSNDMGSTIPDVNWEKVYENKLAKDCTIPMGNTSDEIGTRYNISRQEQDTFATLSHQKAAKAREQGLLR